ncbi:MAG: hypothetical protein ICV66_00335 [Chitinophagaceae bacterium]|nr:hypothetical protein [Chitinophagaceae bacterium]
MFNLKLPQITLTRVNWWQLLTNKSLQAKRINIDNASFNVFLDRTLPSASNKNKNNFPHQLLMHIHMPVYISDLRLNRASIAYTEYSPLSKRNGTVYFDGVNATVTNITNIPEQIRRNNKTTINASTLFMHKVPSTVSFHFDLSQLKTGDYSADVKMSALDSTIVNPIAEPMGLFTVKRGSMQKAIARIHGNNYNASGKVLILYKDLHLTPLKPDQADSGKLTKKHFTSFIANSVFVKDENPSKGEAPRNPVAYRERKGGDLFNLTWKTMLIGLLKTIGIPEKYAD